MIGQSGSSQTVLKKNLDGKKGIEIKFNLSKMKAKKLRKSD